MREEDLRLRRIEHTAKRGVRIAGDSALSHVFYDTNDFRLANIRQAKVQALPNWMRPQVLRGEGPIHDDRLR